MSRGWTNLLKRPDIIAKLEKFIYELPDDYKKSEDEISLNLNDFFENSALPLELEIGCGKGEFIAHKSNSEKEINFVGIEVKPKRIVSIVQKLDLETNKNIKILNFFLDKESVKLLSGSTFEKIYINYPDPWPKKRHHKKRLIDAEFVNLLLLLLEEKGILQIITDNKNYAEQIKAVLEENKNLCEVDDCARKKLLTDRKTTYFEEIKREEGFEPNIFLFQKI